MSDPKDWGRKSLNNEIVILDSINRYGSHWQAEGQIDGETMRVSLYIEHIRAIERAGYKVTWDKPQIAVIDAVTVALVENGNEHRRVAAVLKCGTDEWIEVRQKGKIR